MAERVGFEPTVACATPVFKTGTLNQAQTSLHIDIYCSDDQIYQGWSNVLRLDKHFHFIQLICLFVSVIASLSITKAYPYRQVKRALVLADAEQHFG